MQEMWEKELLRKQEQERLALETRRIEHEKREKERLAKFEEARRERLAEHEERSHAAALRLRETREKAARRDKEMEAAYASAQNQAQKRQVK